MSKLSRIEIICDMSKFSLLKSELSQLGVRGMTFIQVLGCGAEKGTKEYEVDEVQCVVASERVAEIVDRVEKALYTGHIGDGKIFVMSLDDVIRVRTGDHGEKAL